MMRHLRQSNNWSEYLKFLKWETKATSKGTKIYFLKTPFGQSAKIQRPNRLDKEELQEIRSICTTEGALFIKIDPGENQDMLVLSELGYQVSKMPLCPPSTVLFDLSLSEESLWRNISRSGKKSIRRSEKEESEFRVLTNPSQEELERFYKVAQYTAKTKKYYIEPLEDIFELKRIFKDDFILLAIFGPEETLMSVMYFVANDGVITSIGGGTTPKGREGSWGYSLLWKAMLYFKKAGYKCLDTDMIDDDRYPSFTRNWGGISYFTEKFGGRIVRYPPTQILYIKPELKTLSKIISLPF